MKLKSLYIENFGGLSKYSLNFEDGLTVIEEANGFGKTTLAEFIRAMFYGFPRKGKTLDKSRRQKYTPWNGGKFGGYLLFEAEGIPYRLERSFGATPKGDSFVLIDLNTGKKSSRYTEDIGLELFGLDADAFERSTYLPQLAEAENLTTDSIRSKLSNLVDDTNDVGNYEKAVAALKLKRSSFVPYRGSGGSVMQAGSRISQLQEQLARAEGKKAELEDCSREIEALKDRTEVLQTASGDLREAIHRAAESEAVATVHRQYRGMQEDLEAEEDRLAQLERKYPAGIPDEERIEKARQDAARLQMLKEKNVTDPEDLEAEAYLKANRQRFDGRIPSEDVLDDCRSACREYIALLAEVEGKGLSGTEMEQYARLQTLCDAGQLETERLEALTKANREREGKIHQHKMLELPEDDERKLRMLQTYFAAGVPQEMNLREKEGELEKLRQLRQEQSGLVAEASQRPRVKSSAAPTVALLILGVLAGAAGIYLLMQQVFLWGGIGLGAGLLSLLGSLIAAGKLKKNRELEEIFRAQQKTIRANDETIRKLKESLAGFAGLYSTNDAMDAALYEIRDHRDDYLELLAKQEKILEKRQILDEEIEKLEEILRRELGEGDFGEAILKLRVDRDKFLSLQMQQQREAEEAAALRNRARSILQQIQSFLTGYGIAETEDLHGALSELERSSDAYLRAEGRFQKWQEEKMLHGQEMESCAGALEAFFGEWSLEIRQDSTAQLLQIRDDRKDWEELKANIRKKKDALKRFREENAQRLEQILPENPEDPRILREKEMQLNQEIQSSTEKLLQLQQHQRQLKTMTEQIPVLRDDLQMWQEKKCTDQHSADLLDDTMAFLEQAKENLSNSYLGPIRRSFGGYLGKLWPEQDGQILVTQDLDVQLERYGEVRELGYFSAGQADLVMLCMRLALVDALFGETCPCVILDDPFVNLDDRRTKEALALLKELSRNRQILYLTCSSSRKPS